MQNNPDKVYVSVEVTFGPDGNMRPVSLKWEDGRVYPIDRLLSVRPSFSRKAGGQGDMYTVRIRGNECHLFFERSTDETAPAPGRWFVARTR